ncbi:Type 2A phosphatase-associated protein 42 [Dispira parvispora]|uniref:Type 2A phosphatase-associated protein 42 n=1 Tax=Dispira parvispora TaxID=1520584 RepID=A0A9W8AID8_9FUNG|nr:Type 2A phosphatase-associated protein 42 [Dispira parvispora]
MASSELSVADTEGVSLKSLFTTAQQEFEVIESLTMSAREPAYQDQVQRCLSHFNRCRLMVNQLALFSTNESLDDLATGSLRYLVVEAYMGHLVQKLTSDSPSTRPSLLKQARDHYDNFYRLCDAYGLVEPVDQRLYQQRLTKSNDSTLGVTNRPSREEKITRFKRRKQLEQTIHALETALGPVDRSPTEESQDDNETTERQLALNRVQLQIHHTLEALESIQDEYALLAMAAQASSSSPSTDSRAPGQSRDESEDRLDQRPGGSGLRNAQGPLLSQQGKVMRPFIITDKRRDIQESVFRPGWRLPTMSVEEYLAIEQERGGMISGGGQVPSSEDKDVDHDGDPDAQDRETYKQREWDNFKDDNPRGWGNRKGKG